MQERPLLEEGQPAPDFTLPNEEGQLVSLSDYRGRRVVLYMYPKDNTPGCTAQACDLRDNLGSIEATDAVVLGLSPDSVASHKRFKERYGLTFTLLSDEGGKVASLYGAWVEKSLFGRKFMGIERSTFIIDEKGILRKILRKVRVKGHVDRVLRELEGLDAS